MGAVFADGLRRPLEKGSLKIATFFDFDSEDRERLIEFHNLRLRKKNTSDDGGGDDGGGDDGGGEGGISKIDRWIEAIKTIGPDTGQICDKLKLLFNKIKALSDSIKALNDNKESGNVPTTAAAAPRAVTQASATTTAAAPSRKRKRPEPATTSDDVEREKEIIKKKWDN